MKKQYIAPCSEVILMELEGSTMLTASQNVSSSYGVNQNVEIDEGLSSKQEEGGSYWDDL